MSNPATTLPPRIGHVFRLAAILLETTTDLSDRDAIELAKAILEHPRIGGCGFSRDPE